jgi:hypothetical protein
VLSAHLPRNSLELPRNIGFRVLTTSIFPVVVMLVEVGGSSGRWKLRLGIQNTAVFI